MRVIARLSASLNGWPRSWLRLLLVHNLVVCAKGIGWGVILRKPMQMVGAKEKDI
jgi:hypothetical protein